MVDDLIVNGCGTEEHDQNMHVVLTRFRAGERTNAEWRQIKD